MVNLYTGILNSVEDIKGNPNSHTVLSDVQSHATRSEQNLVYSRCSLSKTLKCHPVTGIQLLQIL